MKGTALELGDKLRVQDSTGVYHLGIVVRSTPLRHVEVAHNGKGHGVEFTNFDSFANGRKVEIVSRVTGGWVAQQEVVQRARNLVGKAYDLLNFNCEHFANYVQTGRAESPQLRQVLVAVAVIVGVGFLLREA